MAIFFTADTHFGDEGIMNTCNRPFETETEMNRKMTVRWNLKVQRGDTVYHLGDFGEMSFRGSLNGDIVFIKGNHDKFDALEFSHIKIPQQDEPDLEMDLMHDPVLSLIGYADISLHGHVHTMWKDLKTFNNKHLINVGVDMWDFYPVSVDDILSLINRRERDGYVNQVIQL